MIKDFFKHLSIYGIIPVINKGVAFFLLPIYTIYLSPEEFGIFDLSLSIFMFVNILISIEIYNGVGSLYYNKSYKKSHLISSGFWLFSFNGILILTIFYYFSNNIESLLDIDDVSSLSGYLRYFFFLPLLMALSDYFSVMMRFENKPKFFILVTIIQLTLKVAITLLLLTVYKYGLFSLFVGICISHLVSSILFVIYFYKNLIFIINIEIIKKIIFFSLPIVPAALLISFSKPLYKAIISDKLDLYNLGLFSLASSVASIFLMFQFALRLTYRPFIFKNSQDINFINSLQSIFNVSIIIFFVAIMFLIIFISDLYHIFIDERYFESYKIVGFLSFSFLLNILSEFMSFGPDLKNRTYYHSIVTFFEISTIILLLISLTNYFGLYGVGISLLISSFLKFALYYLITNKLFKYKLQISAIVHLIPLLLINILITLFEIDLLYRISLFLFSTIYIIVILWNSSRYLLLKNKLILYLRGER